MCASYFNFPSELLLDLSEEKILNRRGIVQEWKGEDADHEEQDRHSGDDQRPQTNPHTPPLHLDRLEPCRVSILPNSSMGNPGNRRARAAFIITGPFILSVNG
jgi:hypothetical protein